MECITCKEPLSFISRKIEINTPIGKTEVDSVQLTTSLETAVILSVVCLRCNAVHDIEYMNPMLIQVYDRDGNCLYGNAPANQKDIEFHEA